MIDTITSAHSMMTAILAPLGMAKFSSHALFLAVCLSLAVVRGIYLGIRYRPLTPDEIEELSHRPDCFHILEKGRIPRW